MKTKFGEMKESFIALNVCACEVSCRAGTIKCSRSAPHEAPNVSPDPVTPENRFPR